MASEAALDPATDSPTIDIELLTQVPLSSMETGAEASVALIAQATVFREQSDNIEVAALDDSSDPGTRGTLTTQRDDLDFKAIICLMEAQNQASSEQAAEELKWYADHRADSFDRANKAMGNLEHEPNLPGETSDDN